MVKLDKDVEGNQSKLLFAEFTYLCVCFSCGWLVVLEANVYVYVSHYFAFQSYKFLVVLQAKFLDFKIQNMVGSCDVKFPIRLEGLVLQHGQFSRSVYCTATLFRNFWRFCL